MKVVPPLYFALYDWWMPQRAGRPWFYHTPRSSAIHPSAQVDLETVDPLIRESVALLHRAGVPTWPSCQGHWCEEVSGKAMYQALLRDAQTIRREGLKLVHTESGQEARLQDPNWYVLWDSPAEFMADVAQSEGYGFLALCPPQGSRLWAFVNHVPHALIVPTNLRGYPTLAIHVQAPDAHRQQQAWATIERLLRSLV